MSKTLSEKYVMFRGTKILILRNDGVWHVALRPVLETLNVDVKWYLEKVKTDNTFGPDVQILPFVAADGKIRKMICLPDLMLYCWLLSIDSNVPDFIAFKKECCYVLHKHFYGRLSDRVNVLSDKSAAESKILELEKSIKQKLEKDKDYIELKRLKGEHKRFARELNEIDVDVLTGQLALQL